MQTVDVSILIVNYNTGSLLDTCIRSAKSATTCTIEIIVVDNASSDSSATLARTHHPEITLIENSQNAGFAAAVNQASRHAQGRYLFLLNPDSIVQPEAIDKLVAHMDAHPAIGISAPRNRNATGEIYRNFQGAPKPWRYLWRALLMGPLHPLRMSMRKLGLRRTASGTPAVPPTTTHVDAVYGNSLMVRAELYHALGGLDERFFMYIEDLDLCLRAKNAGHIICYVPEAEVIHYGGQSSSSSNVPRLGGMIAAYVLPSRYTYVRKHFGLGWTWLLRTGYLVSGVSIAFGSLFLRDPQRKAQQRTLGHLLINTPIPTDKVPAPVDL